MGSGTKKMAICEIILLCMQALTRYLKGDNEELEKVAAGKPTTVLVYPKFKFTAVENNFTVAYFLPEVTEVRLPCGQPLLGAPNHDLKLLKTPHCCTNDHAHDLYSIKAPAQVCFSECWLARAVTCRRRIPYRAVSCRKQRRCLLMQR